MLCILLAPREFCECLVNWRLLSLQEVLGQCSVPEGAWSVLGPLVMLQAVQGGCDEGMMLGQ